MNLIFAANSRLATVSSTQGDAWFFGSSVTGDVVSVSWLSGYDSDWRVETL